jgi:hypothetical protein
VNGVGGGLVVELLPPPSQLISRRPLVGRPYGIAESIDHGFDRVCVNSGRRVPNELLRENLARTSKKKITGNHERQEVDDNFACRASHKMLLSG